MTPLEISAEKRVSQAGPAIAAAGARERIFRLRMLLPALLIVLGAAVCFHELFLFSDPGRDSDFAVYFAAGRVAASGGNPFSTKAVGGELKVQGAGAGMAEYLYSSTFLVFLEPLLRLSLRQAHRVFELLTYLAVAASIVMIWRSVKMGPGRLPLWVPVLLLVWSTPFWSNIALTQANGIILFFLAACFYLSCRCRNFWAGVSLAGAVAIKFTPALLLFYFAFRRRWRALAGFAAAAVFLEAVSWLYFGLLLDAGLPRALFSQTSAKLFYWDNQSFPAALARIAGRGSAWAEPVSLGAGAILAAATLLTVWRRRRSSAAAQPTFALLVTAFLLIPNYLYGHHLIQLLLPLSVIAATIASPLAALRRRYREPLIGALTLAFILIELDYWRVWQLLDQENWGWWAHPGSWGLLILWGAQMSMLVFPAIFSRIEAGETAAWPDSTLDFAAGGSRG